MVLGSRTGLLESVKVPLNKPKQVVSIEFPSFSRPAPYVLRPFAGVYNPFPYGCSILCNHPADIEAKDVVKRAKDSWASDGKALLLPEELLAIRASLLQNAVPYEDGEDAVPEELFRRYTDTDSRPPTPAPTLASGTRGSGRRCVTPDPTPTVNPVRERTLLVLDLRRSHSQDTLSCLGLAVPPTRTPTPSVHSAAVTRKKRVLPKKKGPGTTPTPRPKSEAAVPSAERNPGLKVQETSPNVKCLSLPATPIPTDTGASDDEDLPKRRGKRLKSKKSGKGNSEPDKEFQGIQDPGDTQISTLGDESQTLSARPSTSGATADEAVTPEPKHQASFSQATAACGESFIDAATLKRLQRELDQETVDAEFAPRRKRALEEAMKCRPGVKRPDGKEMKLLRREMRMTRNYGDDWLSLPRTFTRQSSRFELPLDSRTLDTMTPMEYAQRHVSVSSGRLLLYNKVYNRHIEEMDDEEVDRQMSGHKVTAALGEVMGHPLSDSQARYFHELIGWDDSDLLDFRTWSGISALCERLLADQFMPQGPSRTQDPCHEVEQADFETLPRKLHSLSPDPRLKAILIGIREL